jgi:hypothetical protein
VLPADQDHDALVVGVEEVTRAIVGAMSDKEYLTRSSKSGTMPWLNRVFEELGIHHEEHVVPPKVLASIEKKQKAAAKNATIVAKSKKRKGQASLKALSKKQKVVATSATSASPATSSASASEEGSVEDTGGAQDASTRDKAIVDLVSGGGGGVEATEALQRVLSPWWNLPWSS